ncbi:MAK10-like protein [Tanacetum coccineum]
MGDENPIHTLGDYSKPSHEGYRNTIELPVGNNVDPNQHLKDFLKLVDSLDLDGSITTWEDLTTHFLAQFFPPRRTAKLHNDILMFQQHHGESLSEAWTRFKDLLQKVPHHGIDLWLQVQIFYDHVNPVTRRTIDQSAGGKLRDRNAKESWALLEDLALYDNESWNDPRDFAKPVKAIALPQDVPSTSDRRLIELENQVQRLMEAHLALTQPTQVNKITTSCEICSGPHDTQYCMEDPEQAFVEYASSRTNKAGERLVSNFMASQDARLTMFEADFKQQHSEMTNKIDTVLKAITDRIAGALPSDTVKNPKLSTYLVLSARSYPTEDQHCSTHVHGLINTVTICPKQPNESQNGESEEEEQGKEGNPEDTNTMAHNKEQRDTPQLELKDMTAVNNLGPDRIDEGIEWIDTEEPLDLIDTSEESVYESLIQFTANAYIDIDLPMNIMSLAYYNSIRKNGYEYIGRNFIGLGRDIHVFVGNMSYVMDFTILESIETNIDPSLSNVVCGRPFVDTACLAINRKYGLMTFMDGIKKITFKTPYKDLERSEFSCKGHELLSSRVILSEDDYDRGCRKPSDLEDGFYKDTIKLGPEYLTGMDDE